MSTSTIKKVRNGFFGFLCLSISLYALSHFFQTGFLNFKGEVANSLVWKIAFHMHFIGGAVALGIGWIQFLKNFRSKHLTTHRLLGKAYIISILLSSAPGAMYMSVHANGGFNNVMGFGMMALIWFAFTLKAYLSIRQGDIDEHEKWMIRSFAVTLAAVSLRIFMPIMIIAGVPEAEAYQAISWFCWVPNLFVAEWVIRKRGSSPAT